MFVTPTMGGGRGEFRCSVEMFIDLLEENDSTTVCGKRSSLVSRSE